MFLLNFFILIVKIVLTVTSRYLYSHKFDENLTDYILFMYIMDTRSVTRMLKLYFQDQTDRSREGLSRRMIAGVQEPPAEFDSET